MRLWLLAVVLLPLAGGLAGGHAGEGFPHVNPSTQSLGPGKEQLVELTFTEGNTGGKFEAGWVFVLNLELFPGAALEVALRAGHIDHLNATAATWRFDRAGSHHVTGPMPVTDVYTLVFRNPATQGNASYAYFYDQSCNCAAKPIPPEDLQHHAMPGGMVIFNADVKKGAQWEALFFEPAVHTFRVDMAKRVNASSVWPADFAILQSSARGNLLQEGARQHAFTWTADETTRYYFVVQSTGVNMSRFDPKDPGPGVMVIPHFEQLKAGEPEPTKPSPVGMDVVVAAALGVALTMAWRKR